MQLEADCASSVRPVPFQMMPQEPRALGNTHRNQAHRLVFGVIDGEPETESG